MTSFFILYQGRWETDDNDNNKTQPNRLRTHAASSHRPDFRPTLRNDDTSKMKRSGGGGSRRASRHIFYDQHRHHVHRKASSGDPTLRRRTFFAIVVAALGLTSLLLFVYLSSKLPEDSDGPPSIMMMNLLVDHDGPAKPSSRQLRNATSTTMLPLTAYLEEPIWNSNGTRTQRPLPIRKNPHLRQITYHHAIQSCRDLPNGWPVDHPREVDAKFGPTVGTLWSLYSSRDEYASKWCPVDADPFLPWIHDVFANQNGQFIEFVAHNKRRCRTGPSFQNDLQNLEPQVALMQSVPIKRLTPEEVQQQAFDDERATSGSLIDPRAPRYRLSSIEEADEDGKETRFICRFHSSYDKSFLGETLSVFPYNYEHDNFRKGPKTKPMLSRPYKDAKDKHGNGANNEAVWNAILHFRCPVPSDLQHSVRTGSHIDNNNDIPSIYLDLVPIRTPPRETRDGYCPQVPSTFDPKQEWGDHHILPPVEESGRWSNIPICRPPQPSSLASTAISSPSSASSLDISLESTKTRPQYLIGCLWASAAFSTRGADAATDTSTSHRLLEWLAYHLFIAKFDHVYVYDNTDPALGNSLQPVLDLFDNNVTRIPWKHRVCNNNRPMHVNAGERSSQYAAEASCRIRYGPLTEWIAQLDTDEYLIPASNWTDIRTWLQEADKQSPKTRIHSFFQTRALPNVAFMDPLADTNEDDCRRDSSCLAKRSNVTFLQAYDCKRTPLPKPYFGWRAKKQIYDPRFVLDHFVHYSTVTARLLEAPKERSPPFNAGPPYERRSDELTEAFMLHTKTTYPAATKRWKNQCRKVDEDGLKNCPVGIAHDLAGLGGVIEGHEYELTDKLLSKEGFAKNCYPHARIQHDLAGQLEELLVPFRRRFEKKTG